MRLNNETKENNPNFQFNMTLIPEEREESDVNDEKNKL